jgi:hypothetical protein
MKGMFLRIGKVIYCLLLIAYVVIEIVFYSLRWIVNGKALPDYPLFVKKFFDL